MNGVQYARLQRSKSFDHLPIACSSEFLDTNILSILQAGRTPIRDRVENRLLREPNSLVFATIVSFQELPFEDQSLAAFHELRRQRVRIGTRDLRIAAMALARGAKVITQNIRDFEQVPRLLVEDWTV